MKAYKKLFAVLFAVIMVFTVFSFTASASDYSYTIHGKGGYTFTVYKVANYDLQTGAYTYNVPDGTAKDALQTALETLKVTATDPATGVATAWGSSANSADVLVACNLFSDTELESIGTENTNVITFTATELDKTVDATAGVYFVKATDGPNGYIELNNSVFQLPYFKTLTDGSQQKITTIDFTVGTKVNSDEDAKKDIKNSDIDQNHATAKIGDTINFKISGAVVGSKKQITTDSEVVDLNVKKFVLADTMSEGLTFVNDAENDSAAPDVETAQNVKVFLVNDSEEVQLTKTAHYTIDINYTFSDETKEAPTFAVKLTDDVLNETAKFGADNKVFYDYTDVVVEYSAILNEDAVIGGEGNANEASVDYINNQDEEILLDGETTVVYTYALQVTKVDQQNQETKLSGAQFTLYTDADCTQILKINDVEQRFTTDDNGTITFKGLSSGTYYLEETQAPAGYNLDCNVYILTVNAAGSVELISDSEETGGQKDQDKFDYEPVDEDGNLIDGLDGTFAITVTNTHIFLPIAGGPGALMFMIGGAFLVVISSVLFVIFQRSKKALAK